VHNLLVVSDVHLCRDHPDKLRGHQHELAGFLAHHAEAREGGLPWLLVWNGDVLDFDYQAGTMDGRGEEATSLRLLGELCDQWTDVLGALGRFLDAGHSLVVLPGNHDVDLAWPSVRAALRARIAAACGMGGGERVEVGEWFHYEPGRIFVEHGQRFDPDGATTAMLDPFDDGQLRASLSMHWLAGFCPTIPELAFHIDHTLSPLAYVPMLARRYGPRAAELWARYLRFAFGVAAGAGRGPSAESLSRHARRREAIAGRYGLSDGEIEALDGTSGPSRLASRLDAATRLHLLPATLLPLSLGAIALGALARSKALASLGVGTLAAGALADALLSKGFHGSDATLLREGAKRVREVLGVPLVAMGHVHVAEDSGIEGGRYVNSGTWMDRRVPATFVRVVGTEARVLEWAPAVA